MIDSRVGKDSPPVENHFDYIRRLEQITEQLPYAVKQLKNHVSELSAMGKKLSAMKKKAEGGGKRGSVAKLDGMGKDYAAAYKKCRGELSAIRAESDRASELFIKLSDTYAASGNRKAAKRVRRSQEKFERDTEKSLDPIIASLNGLPEFEYLAEAESKETPRAVEEERTAPPTREQAPRPEAERREEERPRPAPRPQYYDPYRAAPPYYQPAPSFNIAPISIDVNRAVESAVENFKSLFEEKINELLSGYSLPARAEEAEAPAPKAEVDAYTVAALEKIADDESFALEKLTALLEKIKGLLSGIGELGESYAALEEKQKAALEASRAVNEMQRALARELQGVQVTQKVINGDQLATVEAQAVILEQQKATLAAQGELSEAQTKLSDEQLGFVRTQEELDAKTQELISAQAELIEKQEAMLKDGMKNAELGRSLTERQNELTAMQRDAIAAQKKLARSQKAINERVGARRAPRTEEAAEVQSEAAEIIAPDGAEAQEA